MDLSSSREVILEHRLEGWYIKTGARLLGNQALVKHVKETPITPDVGKILSPEHTEGVKDGLRKISEMGHFITAPLMVYPFIAAFHLGELAEKERALETTEKKPVAKTKRRNRRRK